VPQAAAAPVLSTGAMGITAPLAGNVFKIVVVPGDVVKSGDVVLILEAMKMETEIRASGAGTVAAVLVKEGASVNAGDTLVTLA
jgi:oxaloacetate decarboxylase alpha subunit